MHSVNNADICDRYCYAGFPKYNFERNYETDVELHSEVEANVSNDTESTATKMLQQATVASTEETEPEQEEDKPLDNNTSNDTITNNDKQDSDVINNLPELPQLSSDNYLTDKEFQDIYQYLTDGQLTDENERDTVLLLLIDQYFIEN